MSASFRFEFSRYLRSKITVDDRALHPRVFSGFRSRWPTRPGAKILELGAGVGTMVRRLKSFDLPGLEYHLLDNSVQNLELARESLVPGDAWSFVTVCSEIEHYTKQTAAHDRDRFDALLAHAVLDLCDLETVVPRFRNLLTPDAILWFTLNFDGWTQWEPHIDRDLDERIINAYHRTMNQKGSGRKLFQLIPESGLDLLDAGPSDWAVFPDKQHRYPADESYFLLCILHFFESSLAASDTLDKGELNRWLQLRRDQVLSGRAVFLAHQWDFLATVSLAGS